MRQKKTISIITPTLNMGYLLPNALNSIIGQNYSHIEHIILDGKSVDGSWEILKRYRKNFSNDYRVCRIFKEEDNGMYDAINKGIKRSNGSILGFLNADDWYQNNLFSDVMLYFSNNPNIYAFGGRARIFSIDSNLKKTFVKELPSSKDKDLFSFVLSEPFSFNAWFFRKEVFEIVGLLDSTFKIAGDKEFMIRFANSFLPYVVSNKVHYFYAEHKNSKTFSKEAPLVQYWNEEIRILRKLLSSDLLREDKIKEKFVKMKFVETCWKIIINSYKSGNFPVKVMVLCFRNEPIQFLSFLLKKTIFKWRE